MKNLFYLVLFFFAANKATAQGESSKEKQTGIHIAVLTDVRQAAVGSDATTNKRALDLIIKSTWTGNEGAVVLFGYEWFGAIDFNRIFVGGGYEVNLSENLTITPILELNRIERRGNWGGQAPPDSGYGGFSYGGTLVVNYYVSDGISLELDANVTRRSDLIWAYGVKDINALVGSVYLGVKIRVFDPNNSNTGMGSRSQSGKF